MLKRIVSTFASSVGLAGALAAETQFSIGSATIEVPKGWSEAKREPERIVLRSADGHQQATVSLMRLNADASFQDFKRLCDHRIEAEKKVVSDGFVQPDAPFKQAGTFGMYFSGGDKKANRAFSGYLTLKKRELITIYVEGMGIAPKDHLESFKKFASGLHSK
jgi:hypothetical protein